MITLIGNDKDNRQRDKTRKNAIFMEYEVQK